MSKYYDLAKPFSLANWKLLIDDVNDILENPPEGTDCEPIEPIEEPEAPKMWEVKDVKEVRDKLIETCPDIEFEAELEIWRPDIIDEIEEAMEQAWCNCTESGDIDIGPFGPFASGQEVEASPYYDGRSNGAEIYYGHNYICTQIPYSTLELFQSYYFEPQPDRVGSDYNIICAKYTVAYDNTKNYIEVINRLTQLTREIDQSQSRLDSYAQIVDVNIAAYNDCIADGSSDCSIYLNNICSYGALAKDEQTTLDKKVTEYQSKLPTKDQYQNLADDAAKIAWLLACSIPTWFPPDKNFMALVSTSYSNYPWMKWFNPKHDDKIGNIDTYWIGHRDSDEIRPVAYMYNKDSRGPNRSAEIKLSPGGFPFCAAQWVKLNIQVLSIPYLMRPIKSVCDQWAGKTCLDGTPACEWGPWRTGVNVDYRPWSQSRPLSSCCVGGNINPLTETIYIPVNRGNPVYPTYTISGKIEYLAGRLGKDYTAQQTEYWNLYDSWYTEHPKYDDRHEAYC